MKCQAYVPHRAYSRPGPCEVRRNVKAVRPDLTIVYLCAAHRALLARQGTVQLAKAAK